MKRIEIDYDEIGQPTPFVMTGYAGTLPASPEDELIARLHQAVKDVTGKPVQPPIRPRMGFLP